MHFIIFIGLLGYFFPTASSILYLFEISPPRWMLSISFLLLDIKMILFLFPSEIFGPYLTILRHVAKQIFSFLLILLFVILAFAHAFFILLRPNNPFDASQIILGIWLPPITTFLPIKMFLRILHLFNYPI